MAIGTGDDVDVFWGEIAPCEHVVQIYEGGDAFMHALERFAAEGLCAGESVVIIATAAHRHALDIRLSAGGIDLPALRARDRYITLDAAYVLSQFMVDGWPDDDLFRATITKLIGRARSDGRTLRAFGEMVAILWSRGEQDATIRLEHLWHQLCRIENFSLFCAYPRTGFTQDAEASIAEIHAAHSKVIAG